MSSANIRLSLGERWNKYLDAPLALLGLVYLACYTGEVLSTPGFARSVFVTASMFIWGIFACDLIVRAITSVSIKTFLGANWLEILALVLPFFRFLRVFRLLVAIKNMSVFFRNRANKTIAYLVVLVPLIWFTGAIGVLDAETQASDPSITNLKEALWWSLATITTVGYGDKFPTTDGGQVIAAVLMIAGIALFSAAAGLLANWIISGQFTEQGQKRN